MDRESGSSSSNIVITNNKRNESITCGSSTDCRSLGTGDDLEMVKKMKGLKIRFGKENKSLCFMVKKDNLFSAPEDNSLAHCVSEDFYMNSGIAKEFKENLAVWMNY